MRGYRKTTDLGNEDCIVMAPRAAYIRPTGLPAGWRRCRLGIFFDLVLAGTDDRDPVAESVPWLNRYDDWCIGLSNGAGKPGDAGVKFVGIAGPGSGTISNVWDTSNACWNPMTLPNFAYVLQSSGVTQIRDYIYYAYPKPHHGVSNGTTRYAAKFLLEIRIMDTNIAEVAFSPTETPTSPYGISDVSSNALRSTLYGSTYTGFGYERTGGWWGTGPSELTHIHVQSPFYNSSLRIFAPPATVIAPCRRQLHFPVLTGGL